MCERASVEVFPEKATAVACELHIEKSVCKKNRNRAARKAAAAQRLREAMHPILEDVVLSLPGTQPAQGATFAATPGCSCMRDAFGRSGPTSRRRPGTGSGSA